jgi:hypothetical protein
MYVGEGEEEAIYLLRRCTEFSVFLAESCLHVSASLHVVLL